MDLISIRRKYKNIRNTIIISFLVVLSIIAIILIKEIYRKKLDEKIYIAYSKQQEQAIETAGDETESQNEVSKASNSKLPQLTQEGIDNINNLYHSTEKRVFLTFDDGPSKNVTPVVLDTLKSENVKATFFLLGSRVELTPDIAKREYDEGHYVASHGYSHSYSQIYASAQSVLDEYNKTLVAIRNAIGNQEYNPHLFRFPGGFHGGKYAEIKKEAKELLNQNGIVNVDWNSLTSDAAGCTTQEEFLQEIDKTVGEHTSVVLLMHDAGNKMTTAESLPQIIAYFRDRGFTFENFYSVIK